MLSNGPGDPKECTEIIKEIKKLYDSQVMYVNYMLAPSSYSFAIRARFSEAASQNGKKADFEQCSARLLGWRFYACGAQRARATAASYVYCRSCSQWSLGALGIQ